MKGFKAGWPLAFEEVSGAETMVLLSESKTEVTLDSVQVPQIPTPLTQSIPNCTASGTCFKWFKACSSHFPCEAQLSHVSAKQEHSVVTQLSPILRTSTEDTRTEPGGSPSTRPASKATDLTDPASDPVRTLFGYSEPKQMM